MLSAQRWLFAPPFAVLFPCKVNKRKCVVPENIHTPPPTEGNRKFQGEVGGGEGVQKEAIFVRCGAVFRGFFQGGVSKIQ